MTDTVGGWVAAVDALVPERTAEHWDHVGLQVGDPAAAVTAVLLCLDVTDGTLDEAAARGAELVLAHHPLLFRPLERLTPATAAGRLALRAARAGIAVMAAHTNLDRAVPGTTDPIATVLGLRDVRALEPAAPPPGPARVKLVTFVPAAATAAVLAALADTGAGRIGAYEACAFRVPGTGTFRPQAGAAPAVGERGVLNEVVEDRVEVVVPAAALPAVVAALRAAHPYEEVAWDAVPLLELPPAGRGPGVGLVGDLPAPLRLRDVADALALGLPAPGLRVAGDLDAPVRRVAACGGAGDAYVDAAIAADADVYVTGDLRHHPALDARTLGLAVVDAGHFAVEAAALPAFRERLAAVAADRDLGARLLASSVVTDPWTGYRPPAGRGVEEGQG